MSHLPARRLLYEHLYEHHVDLVKSGLRDAAFVSEFDGGRDVATGLRRQHACVTRRGHSLTPQQAYLGLAAQHPSAWTQEMDLRPFAERF